MNSHTLVFDIETIPTEESSLSQEELEYLYRRAENEEEEQRRREMMGLWAFTGHLVSVGLLAHEKRVAKILYISDREGVEEEEIEGVKVKLQSFSKESSIEEAERGILEEFWKIVSDDNIGKLVSFNGRSFDGIFLMLKSLILGVKATRNLLGNRYDYRNHVDLLELITFHNIGRPYSLDFICRRMGIASPKLNFDGKDIKPLFEEGRFKEIALYNLGDLIATSELYRRFKDTLGDVLGIG